MQLAERVATAFGEDRVEGVSFTTALKSEMAGRLRVLAERGSLQIPVDEAIANDWHAMSRIVTGGNVRFDADRSSGGHADRFWAAALGLHAVGDAIGVSIQRLGSSDASDTYSHDLLIARFAYILFKRNKL